jgi:hypothetical protein
MFKVGFHFHWIVRRMGSSDNFCLRWNEFHDNMSATFRSLRHDADFCDVTLACNAALRNGDSKPSAASHSAVRAHRVILSACSPFFRDLLKSMTSSTSPGIDFTKLLFGCKLLG